MKAVSVSIAIALVFSLSAAAEDVFLNTKMAGKLTMIALLSAAAFVVRMLVNQDRNRVAKLHERLGVPDRNIEFREGFDNWRLEWYENRVYVLRNGVIYRQEASPE